MKSRTIIMVLFPPPQKKKYKKKWWGWEGRTGVPTMHTQPASCTEVAAPAVSQPWVNAAKGLLSGPALWAFTPQAHQPYQLSQLIFISALFLF